MLFLNTVFETVTFKICRKLTFSVCSKKNFKTHICLTT